MIGICNSPARAVRSSIGRLRSNIPAAQPLAEGVAQTYQFPDMSSGFHVECNCTDATHAHDIFVEQEYDTAEVCVTVTVQPVLKTTQRLLMIWKLLTNQRVTFDTALMMNTQAAINYAAALDGAVRAIHSK